MRERGPRCFVSRIVLVLASLACVAGCAGTPRMGIVYGTDRTDAFDSSGFIRRNPWGEYAASADVLLARMEDTGLLLDYRQGGGFDFYDIIAGRTAQVIFGYESRDRGDLYGEKRYREGNGSVSEEVAMSERKRSTLSYPATEHSGESLPAKDARKDPQVEYGAMDASFEIGPSRAPATILAYGGDLYDVSEEGRGADGHMPGKAGAGHGGKERDTVTRATLAGEPGSGVKPAAGRRHPAAASLLPYAVQDGMRPDANRQFANNSSATPGTQAASLVTASLQLLSVEIAGARLIDRLASPDGPFLLRNEDLPTPSSGKSGESAEAEELMASAAPGGPSLLPAYAPEGPADAGAVAGSGGGGIVQSAYRKETAVISDAREEEKDDVSFAAFIMEMIRGENSTYRDIPVPHAGSFVREDRGAGKNAKGFYAR